jgi:hypothetical protein
MKIVELCSSILVIQVHIPRTYFVVTPPSLQQCIRSINPKIRSCYFITCNFFHSGQGVASIYVDTQLRTT